MFFLIVYQAEYGDWYEKTRDFKPEMYLPPAIIKALGKERSREKIPEEHRKHFGMPDHVAEMQYVQVRDVTMPDHGAEMQYVQVCMMSQCPITWLRCNAYRCVTSQCPIT